MRWGRQLATAAIAGTTLALITDVVLQAALSIVSVEGGGFWWLPATLLERGRWIVLAVLSWIVLPRLEAALEGDGPRTIGTYALTAAGAIRALGVVMLTLPVLWTLATIILRALAISANGDWSVDGRVFTSPYFYSTLIVSYAPWAMSGVALLGIARHASGSTSSTSMGESVTLD
jgi:hypothetical protein